MITESAILLHTWQLESLFLLLYSFLVLVNNALKYKQKRLPGGSPTASVKIAISSWGKADEPVMLCCGISSCTPTTVHKHTWHQKHYLLYSHVTAEHDGTREKAGITSHQLSLYTAKLLPERTVDTVPDLGSMGPGGSMAPKSKRTWPW